MRAPAAPPNGEPSNLISPAASVSATADTLMAAVASAVGNEVRGWVPGVSDATPTGAAEGLTLAMSPPALFVPERGAGKAEVDCMFMSYG